MIVARLIYKKTLPEVDQHLGAHQVFLDKYYAAY